MTRLLLSAEDAKTIVDPLRAVGQLQLPSESELRRLLATAPGVSGFSCRLLLGEDVPRSVYVDGALGVYCDAEAELDEAEQTTLAALRNVLAHHARRLGLYPLEEPSALGPRSRLSSLAADDLGR